LQVWLVLELCTGGSLQDSFKHHGDAFEMVSAHTTPFRSSFGAMQLLA
jgi:serine/threonine protein kinase